MSTRDALRGAAHDLPLRIAIDGPAGAGKSTIGRGLAVALACPYLDTGIMYRAVTLAALRRGTQFNDANALAGIALGLDFRWSSAETSELLVDGEAPDPELRSAQVDANVSEVSAHAAVREVLVDRQRSLAATGCVVMVGRDIGTVVLPDAPVKLWVTASAEERARREAERGVTERDLVTVAGQIRTRDRIDEGRKVSPSVPAADATILSTDGLSVSQSIEAARAVVEAALARANTSAS